MTTGALPFQDNAAFLAELCRYADLLIERAMWHREDAIATGAQGALATRRRATREQHAHELDEMLSDAWLELENRMDASIEQDRFIPWIHLARLFQLTPLDQQWVLIALLPDIDAEYRSVLAQFSGGEHVTEPNLPVSAVASLLAGDRAALQTALLADSTLRHWRVLDLDPLCDVLRLVGGFRIDPALAAYLCGRAAPQLRLHEALPELVSTQPLSALLIDTETRQMAERFVARCGSSAPTDTTFVLQLQ